MKARTSDHNPWGSRWRGLLSISVVIASWELLTRLSLVKSTLLPPFSSVLVTILEDTIKGPLLVDTAVSLKRVLVGYSISAFAALLMGIGSAFNRTFSDLIRPIVSFVKPIPPLAWIPLAILWFGQGDPPAYFLVGLGGFFPIFANTFLGMSLVEQGTIKVARCHGATGRLLFFKVILPQSLPSIFSGLRTGLGVAWMVVITAELVGAQSGLGYMIQVSRALLQSERVIAGMIVIGLTGYGLDRLIRWAASVSLRWRNQEGGTGDVE